MRKLILEIESLLDQALSMLRERSTTIWTESPGWDFWTCAECNALWTIEGGDPEEHGYEYCPSCGREIEEFEHYTLDDAFPGEE